MFTNYIPIVRTCLLCFLPLYLFLDLNYWARKSDWIEAAPHIRLFGKLIHTNGNQKTTRFICQLTAVFLLIILPILLFYFVNAVDIGIPFDFTHGEKNAFWNSYFYFAPFLVEIIGSYYLSNYSVIQISEYLYPPQNLPAKSTKSSYQRTFYSKLGLFFLRLLGIYYLISIFISFGKMIFVFLNYSFEQIVSSETIFGLLLNFYPNNLELQMLDSIFTIFPIDFLITWLVGFIFALKFIFNQIVGQLQKPQTRNLFFLCFIVCSFITMLAFKFMVYYPWMYASSVTNTVNVFTTNTAQEYYPKIVAEKIFSFIFVWTLIIFKKRNAGA